MFRFLLVLGTALFAMALSPTLSTLVLTAFGVCKETHEEIMVSPTFPRAEAFAAVKFCAPAGLGTLMDLRSISAGRRGLQTPEGLLSSMPPAVCV